MSDSRLKFEKHITINQEDTTAIEWLASETTLSKQQLKQVMQKGAVWLSSSHHTRRLRRAKKVLQTGETLHLYYDHAVLTSVPPIPTLISDEGCYSVWNKPCGLLSQGSKWADHCTITRWAEQQLKPQRNSFIVHRLDRAANGLILVAHEKNAAVKLSHLFQQRQITKRYRILVHGQFNPQAQATIINTPIDGRSANSYFRLIEYDAKQNRSLLDVSIDSGRKHQIRRHIASLGYPVVGDRLYGMAGDVEDLQLTAYYLSFICPFSKEKRIFSL